MYNHNTRFSQNFDILCNIHGLKYIMINNIVYKIKAIKNISENSTANVCMYVNLNI